MTRLRAALAAVPAFDTDASQLDGSGVTSTVLPRTSGPSLLVVVVDTLSLRANLRDVIVRVRRGERFTVLYRSRPVLGCSSTRPAG